MDSAATKVHRDRAMDKKVAILGAIVMGDNQIQEPGEHGKGKHDGPQAPGEAICWLL
jgi:hypothetical protein